MQSFLGLTTFLKAVVPGDKVTLPEDGVLSHIFMAPLVLLWDESTETITGSTTVMIDDAVSFGLPFIDGFTLSLGSPEATLIDLSASLSVSGSYEFVLGPVAIVASIESEIIVPVTSSIDADGIRQFEKTPGEAWDVTCGSVSLAITEGAGVSFVGGVSIEFTEGFTIGDTDLIIAGGTITPVFGEDEPEKYLGFDDLEIYLPAAFTKDAARIRILGEDIKIGENGFSGTLTVEDVPAVSLLGMGFDMHAGSITFVQNVLTAGSITGELTLPFFKEANGGDLTVTVAVTFGSDGNLRIAISDDDDDGLVTLTTVLGDLTLSGIAFGTLENGDAYVELAGSLDLIAIGGIELPEISVTGLRITSAGDISMASSSGIGLEEQVIIDLKGFQIEIDAIGFGTDSTRNFVSFTGGVKLTEALPMGVSAKGLQVLWSKNPETIVDGDSVAVIAEKLGLGVECEGVGISFEIPEVLSISGSVTFDNDNERFTGKGQLNLLSLDMTIDAAFIVGKAEGADNADYRYFGVQLETQLPFGIPLGSTGIALYGFSGLFAQNMAPLTVEGVDGFSFDTGEIKQLTFVEDEFHWYKDWYRPASGFYEPWTPEEGAFGFGVGTVFGTQLDNGYMISIDKALVFAFPGPIIMLQGKGNMLTARSALADETKQPIFSSLILFDGNEKSILAALGMDYMLPASGSAGEGGILDAHATSEAFFDFDDSTNWHVYLGEIEKEKRIRAEVFRLFQADSYLMLENSGFRAGASIGIDESFDFEVVSAGLKAWLAGDAEITWAPQYLWGNVDLDADLWLEAFGFEFSMSAHAGIEAQTPTPKELEVDLQFTLDLPWPFDPVDVDINMRWYEEEESSPISPLFKEMSIRDFMSTDCWALTAGTNSLATATSVADIEPFLSAGSDALNSGMPLDARPAVTFTRNVVDNSGVATDVPVVALEDGGDHKYGYELSTVQLHKWDDTAKSWSGPLALSGYWQETGEDAATMLELFGDGPFSFCRNNTSMASGDPADAPPYWIPFTDSYLALNAGGSGYPIDLTPTDLNFEEYAVGTVLGTHSLGPVFTGSPAVASVVTDPAGIKALPIRTSTDGSASPTSIDILFPEPAQVRSMKFYGVKSAASSSYMEVTGTHADGSSISAPPRFELASGSQEFEMTADFANVATLRLTGRNAYLEGFRYIAQSVLDAAGDMSADAAALLEERVCLEPDTIYRISISANTYTDVQVASFDPSVATTTESMYGFFKTEGPPTDLGPYIESEIPESVESPHYAGYDLTLEFNQNYMRTMYGSDITVEVVDENGVSATDDAGNAVTFETGWRTVVGQAPYTTKVYLGALADAGVDVPSDTTVNNNVLDARITSGNSLPAGKRLQAQFKYPDYDTPIHTVVFTTSAYADFASMVADFRTEAWAETMDSAPALSALTDFDAALDAFGLGARNLPEQPDITALYAEDSEATVALLIELPEPVEWDRVALSIASAPGTLSRLVNSDGTRAVVYAESGTDLAAWDPGSHSLNFTFSRSSGALPDLRMGGSTANETADVSITLP